METCSNATVALRQQHTIMENCICSLEATVYYGINMAAWHVGRVCLGTLYCQKYSLTHPNNWNQVFQSLPWPQVYKSKHLGMQTVSTNICERMGHSQELSEFQRGAVIGCHLCNKSSCEISSLLNILQSTVSGILTKWKRLGTTATQPRSGRPCKMTEWGQQMLRRIVCRGQQLSAESICRPPNFMWPSD